MIDDTPEKKAWLANASQARDFAAAHGGDKMTAADRVIYASMMQRADEARSMHDVLEEAARVVARADGYGMSVTGRWLIVVGVASTYTGALWLVLFSVSGGTLPVAALGYTNTTIGTSIFVPGIALWIIGFSLRRSGRRRALR